MKIEEKKRIIHEQLAMLEDDCRELFKRIQICREDLAEVDTEEDTLKFDETHDLEAGLKMIRLFQEK